MGRRMPVWKWMRFAGLLMLFIAAALTVYNTVDGMRAEKSSQNITVKLAEKQEQSAPQAEPESAEIVGEMAVLEVDGYLYIGTLSIEALDLDLPVMNQWDLTRLHISPCRYSGSYKTDDMVICAHNYPAHFRALREIKPETLVVFTTVDGVRYEYAVISLEDVGPNDVARMIVNQEEDTGEKIWDLTLFTCTPTGQARRAVRCKRVNEA